jgi:hypothetical protein
MDRKFKLDDSFKEQLENGVRPQDPATVDNTTIESIHKIDKETVDKDREIGDIEFMYKWIREKSGK